MLSRRHRLVLLAGAAALLPGAARASGRPASEGIAPQAGDIVVTGQRPATEASSGTKTDTPLIETPQSISVIDASTIADLGLQNLNQTLRFVAGVTPETRGSAAEVYDQFKLRGFDAPVYLDGLKLFGSATGYAVPQVDVSRLDRIEVVKGPDSALYGQSSPGGLIAESSKLPLDRPFYGAVSGTYGTYDLYRVDADVGGRLGDGELWRVYGSVNGADQQQQFGKRRRETISAAGTAGAGSSTTFTVLAAYSHDPYNGNYGVWPAYGTLIDDPAGRISTKFYAGEPGDFFRREQFGLTYIFTHDFGGGWALRSAGRYQYVKSRLGIVYTSGAPVAGSDTLFQRASYSTREQLNDFTYDTQLTGHVDTGPLHHSLLFGVDRQVAHSAELSAFGTATPINVFDPVYGTMATPQTPEEVPGSFGVTDQHTRQRQQGIYAQDQIAIGGLRLTLSGRQDWARQASGGQVTHDRKFTWRAGALYKTAFGLAPYVGYSTSFEPNATLLQDGTIAKPTLGKQIEAGAKYQPPGTNILVTAAWFRITESDVVVYDPVSFSASQVGKARSQGVEIEATAPLPHDFFARVAFSRQNVKDVEDVNPAAVGRGLATVGRGGISANLEWAPKSGPAAGLEIGGAVRHVDSSYADYYLDQSVAEGPLRTPAYTVFDALVRYDLGKLSPRLNGIDIGVNATNIFDRKYLTSCFANYGWCWYGNRRTVQATIGVRW
ncbi:MAG: TonB-dependent siderophore receptor [Sphingomonas sp.]